LKDRDIEKMVKHRLSVMTFGKILFLNLILLIESPLIGQEKISVEIITQRALNLMENLSQGNFEEATKYFDETMKKVASPEFLKKAWQSLQLQFGSFQGIKGSRFETLAGYDAIFIFCQFEKQMLDARVIFNKAGEIAGLNFVPHLEAKESPPPAYAKPDLFEEKEVEIRSGDWVLPGTLTIPRDGGPFPALVLVHGSGPNDRDETVGPNKPFRDLAWGLASRGVAVLRYEKRTRVYGEKIREDRKIRLSFTVNDETVEDALSAVKLLRSMEKINPDKIFVLGHSLGGMMIPRIASRDEKIAGFIIMAGLTRPIEEALLEQTRYLLSLQGPLTDEARKKLEEIENSVARIKSLKETGENPEEPLLGAYPAYWLDLKSYQPTEEIKKIERPIFVLQGKRDYQVTEKDFHNWQKALEGRKNVTFKLYAACNHLFMEGQGLPTPNEYLYSAGNVSQQVIEDIAAWIKSWAWHDDHLNEDILK
jgi:dienelactone hydrolase